MPETRKEVGGRGGARREAVKQRQGMEGQGWAVHAAAKGHYCKLLLRDIMSLWSQLSQVYVG
jgi:hypothetical protein